MKNNTTKSNAMKVISNDGNLTTFIFFNKENKVIPRRELKKDFMLAFAIIEEQSCQNWEELSRLKTFLTELNIKFFVSTENEIKYLPYSVEYCYINEVIEKGQINDLICHIKEWYLKNLYYTTVSTYKTYLHKIYSLGEDLLDSPKRKKKLEEKYGEKTVSEIMSVTKRILNEYGSKNPNEWFSSFDVFDSLKKSKKRTRLYSEHAYEILNFEYGLTDEDFDAVYDYCNLPPEYFCAIDGGVTRFINRRSCERIAA